MLAICMGLSVCACSTSKNELKTIVGYCLLDEDYSKIEQLLSSEKDTVKGSFEKDILDSIATLIASGDWDGEKMGQKMVDAYSLLKSLNYDGDLMYLISDVYDFVESSYDVLFCRSLKEEIEKNYMFLSTNLAWLKQADESDIPPQNESSVMNGVSVYNRLKEDIDDFREKYAGSYYENAAELALGEYSFAAAACFNFCCGNKSEFIEARTTTYSYADLTESIVKSAEDKYQELIARAKAFC